MTRLAFALGALLLLASSGCDRVREISACRALSREVNPLLDEVESLSKQPAGGDQRAMAARYGELSKMVKARSQGAHEGLAAALREYASVLESTDAALRAHEEATRLNQAPRALEKRRELERLVKRERIALSRIEAECHS